MSGGYVEFIYKDKPCCICGKVQSSCTEPTTCNRCSLFHCEWIDNNGPTNPYSLGEMYRAGRLNIQVYKYKPENYDEMMRKLIHNIITK